MQNATAYDLTPDGPAAELYPLASALPLSFVGELPRRDDRADTLFALERVAQFGWTRNERTHEILRGLESQALVTHQGSEIRLGARTQDKRAPRIWAGSHWELTEAGRVRLGELRASADVQAPDAASDVPTWVPCAVARSERVTAGEYKVTLANGARSTVARAEDPRGWGWHDSRGGVVGLDTKAQAVESLRKYRG